MLSVSESASVCRAFELFLKRLCEFNKVDVIFGAGLCDVGRSGVGFLVSFQNGMNSHS